MAKKKIITNAMRMLNASKIPFKAIEYDGEGLLDGDGFGSAVAALTGIPEECSYKTLVARGEKNGIMVCCIPVNAECDLKKLAKVCGDKKAELIHVKELLGLTGYIRGGVSPIGMKKKYPTYIDKSCLGFEEIAVSAGVCGVTLLISPADVIKVTNAVTADIVKF